MCATFVLSLLIVVEPWTRKKCNNIYFIWYTLPLYIPNHDKLTYLNFYHVIFTIYSTEKYLDSVLI